MGQPFSGRRVLLVEDEALVAMLLEMILKDMGCVPVGPAATVEEGLAMAADPTPLDAALLDVNVAGRQVFPVAEVLKARGIPFIFSTGHGEGSLPDAWRGHPTVQKPFSEAAIREALMAAMGMGSV